MKPLALVLFLLSATCAGARPFDERWVFVMGSLRDEAMWPGVSNAVVTAAANGMNGVLWSGGISEVASWPAEHLARVERMKRLCAEQGMEIIPTVWPTAAAVARYHPELGEQTTIRGLRFRKRNGRVEFVRNAPVPLAALNGTGFTGGKVRSADVPVRRDALYRISLKVRTEGFSAASKLSLRAFPKGSWDTRAIAPCRLAPTQDWTEVVLFAQSIGDEAFSVRFFTSVKNAKGAYDVKDAVIEEVAPANAGKDLALREGEETVVDVCVPVEVVHASTPMCFTHPGREDYYRRSAEAVKRVLNPKKWFLYCDEIRAGGLCPRCRASGKTVAQLIADDVKFQCAAIRAVCPDATIYSWSDMFDPNHNAREKYFAMASPLTGIWDLIPKDLVICCWKEGRAEKSSVAFFEQLGFRTQVALYYDHDDLVSTRLGLDAAQKCPNCCGVIFATWRYNYAKLPEFCDLIKEKPR